MQESDKSEKETLLEKITSLGEDVSESNRSITTVGILIMVACLAYGGALMSGLTSVFMLPILFTVLLGNQVFTIRTRNKSKKLNELKQAYETKFGAIPSPK